MFKMDLALFSTSIALLAALSSGVGGQLEAQNYFRDCLALKDSWTLYVNAPKEPDHPLRTGPTNRPLKEPCRTYQCLRQSDKLDLAKLGLLSCRNDVDCATDISKMICRNFSMGSYHCDCPMGYAYNTNECQCQPAELCWKDSDPCHKGMKCEEQKCSCRDLSNKLYEPHGGFCVEHRSTNLGLNSIHKEASSSAGHSGPGVVIVGILAACLIIGVVVIIIYMVSARRKDIDLCSRGHYICDGADSQPPGNTKNQPHVAAWDAPSMDFLSEEQTLKYLNRSSSSANALKSPSVATTAELVDEAPSPSGSLPECEQQRQNSSGNKCMMVNKRETSNFENPVFKTEDDDDDDDSDSVLTTKSSNML